jgi:hypothetical protein
LTRGTTNRVVIPKEKDMTAPKKTVTETADVEHGFVSVRTAIIIAAGGLEAWLASTDPVAGGALATGIGVVYLLHRLLRGR